MEVCFWAACLFHVDWYTTMRNASLGTSMHLNPTRNLQESSTSIDFSRIHACLCLVWLCLSYNESNSTLAFLWHAYFKPLNLFGIACWGFSLSTFYIVQTASMSHEAFWKCLHQLLVVLRDDRENESDKQYTTIVHYQCWYRRSWSHTHCLSVCLVWRISKMGWSYSVFHSSKQGRL
jgi:hypothetical protein